MRREKQILRYAQDDIFDSCYTLENLHVDHGTRLDTPLSLGQDDKAIGVAHGFKNARALIARDFDGPNALRVLR